nr:sel1 repeat family protein [Prevotella sp.]
CLQNGIGTKKNIEKAAEYYEMAIKMRSTDGIREAALLYYAQKNYAKSSSLLKQAVNGGGTECIYPYAESLKMGYGMDVNKQQAAIYMLKAAQEGNHIAQNELATMYMKGEGAAKSESSGLNWYKEASVEVPWAQWNAGVCYVDGIGAKVSYDEALLWIADAVQNVKAFGKMFKDKLSTKEDKGWGGLPFVDYVNGVKAYSEKKFDDAETSFKLVEKKKMIDATTMLGVCYNSKDWKKYNVKKAVKYFTTAMESGDSKAKFLMSKLYEEGNGVEKDAAKALKLLMDASDAGYALAQSYLGDMYFEGRGVERSDLAAVQCYQKAMKNGYISSSSLKRLAEYYSKGNGGLRKDENMAKKLVAKATKTDAMENLIKEAF